MNDFYSEIKSFEQRKGITLVAVSKTKPNEQILEFYNAGQRIFGENKVQEMTTKYEELPKDIKWHMIGHLQSNKVKYLAPYVSLIHSVDRLSLMKTIQKEAHKVDRIIDILIQVKIAMEDTKMGSSFEEATNLIEAYLSGNYPNIRCVGLMGMASFVDDHSIVREEFRSLKNYFDTLKSGPMKEISHFKEISMGMSGDYQIAVEEGATIIRVGSKLFGARE